MSLINVSGIDQNFPVLGEDNPSQGFRDNFAAIKTALTQAKNEIDTLESTTAKGVVVTTDNGIKYNDFNGNVIQDGILDYTGLSFFPGETDLTGTQVFLDLRYGLVQKIGVVGNTTIKFSHWPEYTTQARYHKVILMVKFNVALSDPNRFNYKLKFTTELGGLIKASNNLEYEMINNKPSWFLRPSIEFGRITTIYNIDENKLPIPVTASELIIPVTSTDHFPDSGTILIDNEQIKYTSKTSTSLVINTANGGLRGANSTTPATHENNSVVRQLLTDDVGEYEHVFEIWSYDQGETVFVNYINKFLGK